MKNNLFARIALFALLCTSAHAFSMNNTGISTFCQQFFMQLDGIALVNGQMTQADLDSLTKIRTENDLPNLEDALKNSSPQQKSILFSPTVKTAIWESRLAKIDALLKAKKKVDSVRQLLVTMKLNILNVIANQTTIAPTLPSKIDPATPNKYFFTKKTAGATLLIAAIGAGAYYYYTKRINEQDSQSIPAA